MYIVIQKTINVLNIIDKLDLMNIHGVLHKQLKNKILSHKRSPDKYS